MDPVHTTAPAHQDAPPTPETAPSHRPAPDGGYERRAHREADLVLRRLTGDAPVVRRISGAEEPSDDEATQENLGLTDPAEIVPRWTELSAPTDPDADRSPALRRIDAAVGAWVTGDRDRPQKREQNVAQIDAILVAVEGWRGAPGATEPEAAVTALELHVTPLRDRYADEIAEAQRLFDRYQRMDAETAQFAKKSSEVKLERFYPENQSDALMASTRKTSSGHVSTNGLARLDEDQRREAQKVKDKSRAAHLDIDPHVTPKDVKGVMARELYTNLATGGTTVPELQNAVDPSKKPAGEVTDQVVGMAVTYDPSDRLAAARIDALKAAVKQVKKASAVPLPALDVYFPKHGRTITIDRDCAVTLGGTIPDAVFHPPGFLAVAASAVGNPKDGKVSKDVYEFSSTGLAMERKKPSEALVNTIIHELGHVLHYTHDRKRFYNLNFAAFRPDVTRDGKRIDDIALTEVSMYGGGNPREMVAEVFLGAVRGRRFSAAVWEMYDAFGGAPLTVER